MELSDKILCVQERAVAHFGLDKVPEQSDAQHIVFVGMSLKRLVDAETRHVSLTGLGLVESLSRLFVECVCALRGRDIKLPNGTRKRMPLDIQGVCQALVHDVFEPKNKVYDNSFVEFGAVGVVIRLLDKVHDLEHVARKEPLAFTGPAPKSIAHIANYATMALVVLEDAGQVPWLE